MPVRSLFLCVWVWWLQLTALQSERLLLLGTLQYSVPPATELLWIHFLSACSRAVALAVDTMPISDVHQVPVQPFFMDGRMRNRKSRRHGKDSGTTKAEGWNSLRGSSQPEQHYVSCFFLLASRGLPLPPIGWKIAFRFCNRTKGLPGWLVLKSNKDSTE